VDCESSCMPAGSVCCNDGSSTFCNAGSVCIPNGCCPVGQTCAGTGGTTTFADLTTGGSTIPTAAPSVSVLATTPAAQQATQSPGPTVDMQTTPVPSASASASTSTSGPAAHLSAQSSAAGTRAHLSTYSPASTNTSANSPTSHSNVNPAILAIAVVVPICAVVGLALLFILLRRKGKKSASQEPPFQQPPFQPTVLHQAPNEDLSGQPVGGTFSAGPSPPYPELPSGAIPAMYELSVGWVGSPGGNLPGTLPGNAGSPGGSHYGFSSSGNYSDLPEVVDRT